MCFVEPYISFNRLQSFSREGTDTKNTTSQIEMGNYEPHFEENNFKI